MLTFQSRIIGPAKKITSWKEKPHSSALDNFKKAEAGVKWTRGEVLYATPTSRIVKIILLKQLLIVLCDLEFVIQQEIDGLRPFLTASKQCPKTVFLDNFYRAFLDFHFLDGLPYSTASEIFHPKHSIKFQKFKF